MICSYCDTAIDDEEVHFAKAHKRDGYFCDACEFFHYFDTNRKRPEYKLFLEQSTDQNDKAILNRPDIKLSKRLSPLRYPGGKTRLIDFVYHELDTSRTKTLYSPFAGGASVELAMLDAGVVERVVLNDLDAHLMNFYRVCFYQTDALCRMIEQNPLTAELYEKAHRTVIQAFDPYDGQSSVEKAFDYLINNRCSFSGIYNAGRCGGKSGSVDKLGARYNPINIIKRLHRLEQLAHRVTLTELPYQTFIETYAWEEDSVFIIDPPYVEKAKDIYRHAFDIHEHRQLFDQLTSFWHSHPNSDFFVFYDDHPHLYDLSIPDDVRVVARKFSIAN